MPFKIVLLSNGTEARLEWAEHTTMLSADTHGELMDLVAMFLQPLETWDGEFQTASDVQARSQDTVSISIGKVA